MSRNPLAEVFGFPVDNQSAKAKRHRENRLCPYNNKVPNCTKDKAKDPLGVCSIYENDSHSITCPVRFREDWMIAEAAAAFFFPRNATWTSLLEVRLKDKKGDSAGNIDLVLVSYNEKGKITDFGSCEGQAVYISGNIREPFQYYMDDPANRAKMDWPKGPNYPRPDYLSSSRKRLAPQLLFKGGILKQWGKKQAVVIHRGFYGKLPKMTKVRKEEADLAWLVYDITLDKGRNVFRLRRSEIVYTKFKPTLKRITTAEAGPVKDFVTELQAKLDEKLENPPDAPSLSDILIS